jgi:hypothetical protein
MGSFNNFCALYEYGLLKDGQLKLKRITVKLYLIALMY